MWIVLQENSQPTTGYVIVFDPQEWQWGLAEHHPNGSDMLDSVAPSFLAALIHV